jgi:hypothetical protein
LEQLWCCKIQTSAEGLQVTPWGEQVAQPEVDDLDVTSLAYQNVLNLQVAVDNAVAVTIIKGARNLSAEFPGLLFL